MVLERLLLWFYKDWRPRMGWLAFVLLLFAVMTLAVAVATANWVPEVDRVYLTGFLAILLTVLLIERRTPAWLAWILIIGYGFVLTTLWLSEANPGTRLFAGWEAAATHIDLNLRLYMARVDGWLRVVAAGRTSQETIVFATLLLWAMWLLASYAAWMTLRQEKPLHALSLLGVALAFNNYYGDITLMSAGFFVIAAILLVASIHFQAMIRRWQERVIDFSDEIRNELLMVAAGVALFLVMAATILPAIPYRELARAFQRSDAVEAAEDTLGRAFAGVEQPEQGGSGAGSGRVGTFPRSFLLGNAPELYETEVFVAIIDTELPRGWHWQGVSYDNYSGTGWSRTVAESVTVSAAEELAWPPYAESIQVQQAVSWSFDDTPNIAYFIGRPLSFDQEVRVGWRAAGDLAFVRDVGVSYAIRSEIPVVTEEALRQITMQAVPADLLERYTTLPETVPARVHELARDVAAGATNPYDQARALERFLRQYPYSLELSRLPPAGADPVDFFLFDLKQGYCDYYASAMVVMARSIGLPARFASGFTLQNPDASGLQTIRQINAHSWAEIYFPGFGWIEFEPTAGFAAEQLGSAENFGVDQPDDEFGVPGAFAGNVPPIPLVEEEPLSPWWFAGGALLMLLLAGLSWFAWQWRPSGIDGYSYSYDRLRRHWRQVGQRDDASLTPLEFGAEFEGQMRRLSRADGEPAGWWQRRVLAQRSRIDQLVRRYNLQQYAAALDPVNEDGFELWRHVRGPLLLWRLIRQLSRR